MKQVIALFLVCCILGQASVRSLWVLHYQINRADYLKHCVNKDKPKMRCNGKCHLKKRIAASENNNPKEPRMPQGFFALKEYNLFFESAPFMPELSGVKSAKTNFPPYLFHYPEAPMYAVFRPPSRSC